LWISTTLFSGRIAHSRWAAISLVVIVSISLRAIPELVTSPYPVGYDTVNYYIPMITNLEQNWKTVSDDFPLYVLILYFIMVATGLSAHSVVAGSAVALFGLFAIAVFYASRTLLKLAPWQSVIATAFAIVQLSVLRTAWDLHRDLLALSIMLIVFSLLASRERSLSLMILLIALACFTVATDRMVGLLLLASLGAGAVLYKSRSMMILAAISGALFISLLAASNLGTIESARQGEAFVSSASSQISRFDYLVLFGVLNGAIAVPAILGFMRAKHVLLKVPLIVSGVGSLSWLVLSDPSMLVPERWMIIFGVCASLFAGYFILKTVQPRKHGNLIVASVLLGFGVVGMSYAALPYDRPLPLFTLAKDHIEPFMPVTMQFNALDIQDNDALIAAIGDINSNTEDTAIIVGAKHWRGFMELHLEEPRIYKFSEDPRNLALAHARLGSDVYLIEPNEGTSDFVVSRVEDSGRR
jgi:hypothetical protein